MSRKQVLAILSACLLIALGIISYKIWFAPTRILVVNPLPAQAAEMTLNNESRSIKVTCVSSEEAKGFSGYDAVLMYGRGLFLDVDGLPTTLEAFQKDIMTRGAVMGDYAPAAQQRFMDECRPIWIHKDDYEAWAKDMLLPEKYKEVTDRYGEAPGKLLARGDSIAIAAVTYGNVMLFPQPRPALGDDDFKLVHGAKVAPPHSYLAPYLYVNKKFNADAIIHFSTHGNLEFTPGKNAGLFQADWAEVLIGNRPHFYFYTTSNVGEAVIAKRRSHAVLVTHLTPPFVESGMRQKYATILNNVHSALAYPERNNNLNLKREIAEAGLLSDLRLDSTFTKPLSIEDLETIDSFLEEISNEKITGAYYTLGTPYSNRDLETTVVAMAADKIAYANAKKDFEKGKITEKQLHDPTFIRHNYYQEGAATVRQALSTVSGDNPDFNLARGYREELIKSSRNELDAIVGLCPGIKEKMSNAVAGDSEGMLLKGENISLEHDNADKSRIIQAIAITVLLILIILAIAFHRKYKNKKE